MPPKTLVIGANGFIGRAFYSHYQRSYPDTIGTTRTPSPYFYPFDLAQASGEISQFPIPSNTYQYAIIAAAIPNIRLCEQEKEKTHQCNVKGTLRCVEMLKQLHICPILFSSDYVFDGRRGNYREEDPVNPLNEYGKQKAELEKRISEVAGTDYLMIRLGKVYDLCKRDGSLLNEMKDKLERGETIRAAQDQIFAPLYLEDVLKCVVELQLKKERGLFNLCGPQVISRFELAQKLVERMKMSRNFVLPISLKDLNEPFLRPTRTDLNCARINAAVNPSLLTIDQAIANILQQGIDQ